MSTARVPETLLAAAASMVVAWPLTTLFTPSIWVRPTVSMIIVVAVCGMLTRLVTASGVLVALGQLAGLVLAAAGLYGQGHLWHGLPTFDEVLAFNNLLVDARETIQNYAAPAPTTRGIILGIGLAIGATAILVDHLAVMRRSPSMAGLPLLTAFLISASNSGESLHPLYFVAASAVWLLMLGRQGVATLRRWSTTVPMSTAGRREVDDRDGAYGFAAVGRTLAVAGLVAAVLVPVVIPHFPTRYLIDGLGRAADATGFSDGQIGLRSTLDLQKSLKNPSSAPVLSYTTTAPLLTPLRVGVLENYDNNTWTPQDAQVSYSSRRTTVSPPSELASSVARETYRISVDDSRIEAPQIAAPTPLVAGELGGVAWGLDRFTSVASVDQSATSYSFTYLALEPTEAALNQPPVAPGDGGYQNDLIVDPVSEPLVRELVAQVVPANASRIEAAWAIQRFLRSDGGFTYSLKLPSSIRTPSGQVEHPDGITLFLRSRIGYCVQFATAMVMMARASGIPARMAIGFLPGSSDHGTYRIRASDAHAWPELYFAGIGWLRFEPTPSGTQNTVAPSYSLPPTTQGSTPGATGTAATSPTTANPRSTGRRDPGAGDSTATSVTSTGLSAWFGPQRRTVLLWVLFGLLAGILGSLAVPVAARVRLRRRLRAAADGAGRVEVQWQTMVERIGDLGVMPPRGSTPRQAGGFYRREAYLEGEESQAMDRIVAGVERSRYARPGSTVTDIRADTHAVLKAVSSVRRRKDRIRALWWPSDGLVEWGEWRVGAARTLRRPWERLLELGRGSS
jgi:transglutaminase-like putative cysteine protease